MKITFLGATGQVTGSCYHLENENEEFIVDFGLYQGTGRDNELNSILPDFNPENINFMILTHSHIDHCGRIPFLVKNGFKGKIYCTKATSHLAEILLLDSANIMESDMEKENEKREKAGLEKKEALFNKTDVYNSLQYFYPVDYDYLINEEKIKIKFIDAGHLLGSASVIITDKKTNKKIAFSGDIGSGNNALLKNPTSPEVVDAIVTESTYGNRIHENVNTRMKSLTSQIEYALNQNNVILIPAFAVGRTQELTYELIKYYKKSNQQNKFSSMDIYIDSPLGIKAKKIFIDDYKYLNEELQNLIENKIDPFTYKNIHYVKETKESIFISKNKNPKIIISSSGMCEGGRILNHLKELLNYEKSTIIFTGYQGEGTLGRLIKSKAPQVTIGEETINVNSKVITIDGFSGHGDSNMIMNWITKNNKTTKLFITHGEEDSRNDFKETLKKITNSEIIIPNINESFEL